MAEYYKEITIPAASQAGAYNGGWYPIYLDGDSDIQGRLLPSARDLHFTDETGEKELQACLLPRKHINTLKGTWTWFCQPTAIYDPTANKTIVVSLNPDGYRYVSEYNHANEQHGTYLLSTTAAESDDHNNPAICIRSDGKYLVAYTEHNANTTMKFRVSSNAGDASAWATEYTVDIGNTITYAQLWRLSDEDRIYLFTRVNVSGTTFSWNILTSDDDGATWSSPTQLITTGTGLRPYARSWSNGVDKIRFILTRENNVPPSSNSALYSIYYDGAWRNMDGTALGSMPFAEAGLNASSILFTDSGTDIRWIGDVTEGSDGSVHVLYYVYPNGDENNHDLYHASYSSGTWTHTKIVDEGGSFLPLTGTSLSYHSAAVFDPLDWRNVALCRQIDGIYELETWRGNAAGTSWAMSESITGKSTCHNFRPNYAYGRVAGKEPYLFWVGNGKYESFLDYETCIRQHPGSVGGAALVKLDLDGTEKIIRCYYGGGRPVDALLDYTKLGAAQRPEHMMLGTLPVTGNVFRPDSWAPWASLGLISRNVQIDQSSYFPGWKLGRVTSDTRILFGTNFAAATTLCCLFIGKWEPNSVTRQSLCSQNLASPYGGGLIMRVVEATGLVEFYAYLEPAPTLESIVSTVAFPANEEHLIYGEYDSVKTSNRFLLRIDEVEKTANGTAGTAILNVTSSYHCVGQGRNDSFTEPLKGSTRCILLSTHPLPKVFTDTLSRAFKNPLTWVEFGEEVLELDDLQTVLDAITTAKTEIIAAIEEPVGAGNGDHAVPIVTKTAVGALLPEVDVTITNEDASPTTANTAAEGTSGPNGQLLLYLNSGNYWMWLQKFGYRFTNPTPFTVNADGSTTGL